MLVEMLFKIEHYKEVLTSTNELMRKLTVQLKVMPTDLIAYIRMDTAHQVDKKLLISVVFVVLGESLYKLTSIRRNDKWAFHRILR